MDLTAERVKGSYTFSPRFLSLGGDAFPAFSWRGVACDEFSQVMNALGVMPAISDETLQIPLPALL